MNSTVSIIITIAVYLLAMLGIGFYYAGKNKDTEDFYLGGRKLGPLVTAMSAEASDMSSYLLMGLPGLAYLSGCAEVGWTIIGLASGTYISWLIVAKRLRRYSKITDSLTIPQFFSHRFHDKKNILGAISAIVIIVFFVPYTASGFVGCGKLFSSLFGIDYTVAMIVSAVVVVGYTVAGGFMAASMTDFIQSIIMTAALFFVLGFCVVHAGGLGNVWENAKSLPGFFSFFTSYKETTGTSSAFTPLQIITTVSWGLGYLGMPHFLLRFMAIEDEKKLKVSRRVASVWVTISMFVVVIIGIAGRALSANGTIATLSGSDTETLLVRIADVLATKGALPAVMAGLILSGMLASVMSTADSQLLQASSSVSQDLLQKTFGLKLSERVSMLIARGTVLVIAILGIILARNPDSSVFGIVSFAWAGFGAAFGPVMVCALFWKRATTAGAVSGMVAGGVMVFVWKYLIKPMGGVFGIYELLPAFIVAMIAIVAVSLLTPKPEQSIEEEFALAASDKEIE